MAIRKARDQLGRVFTQRCFYLFFVMLALVVAVPFVEPTPAGRLAVSALNVFIMIAVVAAVGRTVLSFVIIVLLAAAALGTQYLGISWGDAQHVVHSWMFGAVLYGATVTYMLRYVFQPDVMTADKLFGAASAYLMLGALWMYLYALVGYFYPGSFAVAGAPATPEPVDLLYFSFTVLTSTGFGDIVPLTRQARAVCVLEQLTGALFVAILIARLAGVYPPPGRRNP
jgi:Ion channel